MKLEKIDDFVGCIDADAVTIYNIKLTRVTGNWVMGTIGNHRFEAEVFREPSNYGLYTCRISKLGIQKPDAKDWGFDNMDYRFDCGFDGATDEGKELSRQLLRVFPKQAEKLIMEN